MRSSTADYSMPTRSVWLFIVLGVPFGVTCSGCAELLPLPDTVSVGTSSDGLLLHGESLEDEGPGFVRARPGEETRWATPKLLLALRRSAAAVAEFFPGTAPLRIGDLSLPGGGRHQRHRSHRTGRDADLLFYITDASGRSARARGWLAFDRFGAAAESRLPGGRKGDGELFFFDDARNWHLVRTLLLDDEAQVQWIFISAGLKARLLRYAIAHEPSREAIFRASWVLQQPRRSSAHRDHFHVRVFCGEKQRALGCDDRGPVWPWLRHETEKPAGDPELLDDEALVRALLDDSEEMAQAPSDAAPPRRLPNAG